MLKGFIKCIELFPGETRGSFELMLEQQEHGLLQSLKELLVQSENTLELKFYLL